MFHQRSFFLVCFLIALSFASARNAFAAAPGTQNDFTRIFYYQEGKNARTSFFNHIESVDVLAPQTYSITSAGELKGDVKPDVLAIAKLKGVKVMPLITNGNFSQNALKILNDPGMQDRAIAAMIKEAKEKGYWGWQIDFEQMDLSYRQAFSDFMQKVGQALKQEGLVSSVAVIAQVSENPDDYPKNLWQRIIGVYDYKSLASSLDFISVMSYDDPESKGPVARYSWMERVVQHSLTLMPKEKLSLGIPLYYWKWDDTRGKLVDIGGYSAMQKTLKKYKVIRGYSMKEEAAYLQYKVAKKKYTIWYENAKSIGRKIDLIAKYDLHGFSAWALGLETPEVHTVIGQSVPSRTSFSYYKNPAY